MTEFKKFRVGDLFEVVSGKGSDKGSIINFSEKKKQDYVEFIGRSSENYGLQGYAPKNNLHINPSNSISISQIGTICALYRKNEWVASQNMFCIKLPEDCSEKSAMYLITVIRKSILSRFSNGYTQYPTLKDISYGDIELPVTSDGSPDWLQMESLVELVQKQHVELVQKLLCEAGFSSLEDTILTDDEQSLLESWLVAQTESKRSASAPVPSALRLKMFKISELFEVHLSNGDNKLNTLPIGDIPLVSSGASNNGIVGYVKSSTRIFPKNSITVDMFGNAFFQPDEFYAVSHGRVNVLQLKYGKYYSENVPLYLTTAIRKVTQTNVYGFSNMLSSNVIKSLGILLPVSEDGNPDFEIISKLGFIFKKLSIRDLRQLLDEQLSKYQSLKNL